MFCWMSVLCFDLFYTFTRSSTSISKKKLSRLIYYSIFACGIPIIVTFFLYLVIADVTAAAVVVAAVADTDDVVADAAIFVVAIAVVVANNVFAAVTAVAVVYVHNFRLSGQVFFSKNRTYFCKPLQCDI